MPNGHLSKFLDFSPSLYPDSVTAIIPITEAPSEAPRAAKNGKKKMKRRNKPIHDGVIIYLLFYVVLTSILICLTRAFLLQVPISTRMDKNIE